MSPNALDRESSAYLRAHANDPVDWHPWNAKTFAKAHKLGKPVFLSIGYQSCHWCHVMQRESFRDADTAGILNRVCIPVKVDREIRPDVDALYMSYVQASTGSGGWPMSVFLTPEGAPFLGGTYFPKISPGERYPSFRNVLEVVQSSWKLSRERTDATATEALDFLRNQQTGALKPITREMLDSAATHILASEDPRHGGFGSSPKFPQAPQLTFLARYAHLTGDERPAHAALRALLAMVRGGVFDHAGGGLFRYSTDEQWLVPHFEKMLYDQGLLLSTIAELAPFADTTARTELAHVALSTERFLARELTRPEGGYYSSIDAEAGGVEGDTYVWTLAELTAFLSPIDLDLAKEFLGVSEGGNWEQHATILTRRAGREAEGVRAQEVDSLLARILEARASRTQPATIENTIVSWNALAARGLIEAGLSLGEPGLVESGLRTVDWLCDQAIWRSDVLHAIGDRSVAEIRFLEDSANVAAALIAAHGTGSRPKSLKTALKLHRAASDRFRLDSMLTMSTGDSLLPMAIVEQDDAPTPCGASIHAENALALSEIESGALTDDARSVVLDALGQLGRTAEIAPGLAGQALAVTTRALA